MLLIFRQYNFCLCQEVVPWSAWIARSELAVLKQRQFRVTLVLRVEILQNRIFCKQLSSIYSVCLLSNCFAGTFGSLTQSSQAVCLPCGPGILLWIETPYILLKDSHNHTDFPM